MGVLKVYDGTAWHPAGGLSPVSGEVTCIVENSGTQSVSAATVTALTFDTDSFDPLGMHDTLSNTSRIVVPESGRYLGIARAYTSGNPGVVIAGFGVNGTFVRPAWYEGSNDDGGGGVVILDLEAGDYVESLIWNENAVSWGDAVNANQRTYFALHKLGGVAGDVSAGTAFPASPSLNQRYRRTDIDDLIFYYDGTRWLSETVYAFRFPAGGATTGVDYTMGRHVTDLHGGLDLWLIDWRISPFVVTTNDGSNYWTFTFNKRQADNTNTDIVSQSTASGTPTTWQTYSGSLGEVLDVSVDYIIQLVANKTGSPGGQYVPGAIRYRLIAT